MAKAQAQTYELLDTTTLAHIHNMQLLARTVVEGFIMGLHKSPFRGFSVEFAEYRQHVPGDDIKFIDWKVYAKTDKYYMRQFEEETNLVCNIVLDASASMKYGSLPLNKFQYAARLAACLAYFMIRQRDASGLVIFDTDVRTVLPPRLRQSHLQHLLSTLQSCEAGGETELAGPLHQVAETMKSRGLVILISDMLGDIPSTHSALQHLKFEGHDVIIFQVLDPDEINFPFDQITEFTDIETGQKNTTSARAARALYIKEFNNHQTAVKDACDTLKIDHVLLNTGMPLDIALSEYLYKRGRVG